jgi:hypothetical protein
MKLILKKSSDFAPTRITCIDKLEAELATVYCDGDVKFTLSTLSVHEIKQILVIAENFNLFKTNLTQP